MQSLRWLTTLAALSAVSCPCLATGQTDQAAPPQGESAPAPRAPSATQGLPKVCVDVQSADSLTNEFANRLKDKIAASGALSVASPTESCSLQLHVPGNLLRFETETGIMVSTVVIVTSSSGRYLSTSIAACQANELKPCAARAASVAKLALLMTSSDGTS